MNPFSVTGKRVLITGGTAGIGLGAAKHLADAGAQVVITGRRASGADIAAQVGAQFVKMDVSDSQSVADGMAQGAALLAGTIDVLMLNAGIGPATGTIDALDMGNVKATFDVNLYGVIYGLKDALPYMASGSSVIITSSPAGTTFMAGMTAYSTSKAAVNALTRIWAIELGPQGIRVNAVLPGLVKTEFSFDPDGDEEELQTLRLLTQTNKIRYPHDFGPTFQFLASDASSVITGALIACDDGVTAGYSNELLAKAFGNGE